MLNLRLEYQYNKLMHTLLVCLCLSLCCTVRALVLDDQDATLHFDGALTGTSFSHYNRGTYLKSRPLNSTQQDQVTISLWVKVNKHKQHNWLAGTEDRTGGWSLFVDAGEKACFGLFQDNALKTISSRSLQLPKSWHFVTGVFRNGTIQVYVDAQPGEVVPLNQEAKLSVEAWTRGITVAGCPQFSPFRLDGEVHSVQIWDVARTQGQIAKDMISIDKKEQGLVAYWPLRRSNMQFMPDVVADQYLFVAGDGGYPEWQISNAPLYIHASKEGSKLVAELSLARDTQSLAYVIVKLPLHNLDRSEIIQTTAANTTSLGSLPLLPWPMVPNRKLRLILQSPVLEDETALHDCEKMEVRIIANMSSVLQNVNVILPLHSGEITNEANMEVIYKDMVRACHFTRYDENAIGLKSMPQGIDGVSSSYDLTLLFLVDGTDLDEAILDKISTMNQSESGKRIQTIVIEIGQHPHLTQVTLQRNGLSEISIFKVNSAVKALHLAQALAMGDRVAFARSSLVFADSLDALLEEMHPSLDADLFSFIIESHNGDRINLCSLTARQADVEEEDSERYYRKCSSINDKHFANYMLSALGGDTAWWPFFAQSSIVVLNANLFVNAKIEEVSPIASAIFASNTQWALLTAKWHLLRNILRSHGAWEGDHQVSRLKHLNVFYRKGVKQQSGNVKQIESEAIISAMKQYVKIYG